MLSVMTARELGRHWVIISYAILLNIYNRQNILVLIKNFFLAWFKYTFSLIFFLEGPSVAYYILWQFYGFRRLCSDKQLEGSCVIFMWLNMRCFGRSQFTIITGKIRLVWWHLNPVFFQFHFQAKKLINNQTSENQTFFPFRLSKILRGWQRWVVPPHAL